MSTKIANGWLIERELGLADLSALAAKLRPRLTAIAEADQTAVACRAAARAHDQALMGICGEEEVAPSHDAYSHGRDAIHSARDEGNGGGPEWMATKLEVVFMAVGEGRALAVAYGAQALVECFAKGAKAKPYGYWDQGDPPDGVGPAAWNARRRDWEKALGGRSMPLSPSEAGVASSMVPRVFDSHWLPKLAQVVDRLAADPEFSTAKRAQWLALATRREEHFAKEAPTGSSEAARALRNFERAARAEPMASELAALAAAIEPFLPALGVEALEKSMPEIEQEGAALRLAIQERSALLAIDSVAASHGARRPGL